jgi:hypothetical protein
MNKQDFARLLEALQSLRRGGGECSEMKVQKGRGTLPPDPESISRKAFRNSDRA